MGLQAQASCRPRLNAKSNVVTRLLSFTVIYSVNRAGARAVDLGGPSVYQGGQSLKLITKASFQKSKLVDWGGPSMSIGGPGSPLGAGPDCELVFWY